MSNTSAEKASIQAVEPLSRVAAAAEGMVVTVMVPRDIVSSHTPWFGGAPPIDGAEASMGPEGSSRGHREPTGTSGTAMGKALAPAQRPHRPPTTVFATPCCIEYDAWVDAGISVGVVPDDGRSSRTHS